MSDFGPPANNGDIDNDVKARLAAFSNKLKARVEPTSAIVSPAPDNQVSTPAPVAAPAAPATEPKVETPVATQPPAQVSDPVKELSTEPAVVVELVEDAWDKALEVQPTVPEPFTIESLSSALKLDGVKSKDELVAKFTGLETKVKELETAKDEPFSDLDDDLKEVVKVAKSKGDWKTFLSTKVVDYSQVDPVKLFENSVEQSPRYRKPDGTIDFDAVDAALAEVPIAVKEAQGNSLKQQLINGQTDRRNQIFQEAERKKAEFNSKLAEASKDISKALPKDKVGITLEPKHSDFLYQGVRDGSLIEKHLGKMDVSGIPPDKLLRTLAFAEWGENIAKHNLNQGIVQGKKQLLAQTQNVQLQAPPIAPDPLQPGAKVESAADKMRKNATKYVQGAGSL